MNTTQAPIDPTTMGMEDPAEVMAARRKQELAMALLKQLQGGAPQPQQTRILAKQSLGNVLMNTAAQSIAGDRVADADKQMGAIAQRQQGAYSAGVGELMNAPDQKAAIAKAMASNNPALRALAAAQEKARAEAAEKAAERQRQLRQEGAKALIEKGDTQGALQILAENGVVDPNRQVPSPKAPTVTPQVIGDKTLPLTTNFDPKTGKQTGTLGSLGQETKIILPGQQQETAASKAFGEDSPKVLKETRAAAEKAIQGLESSDRILSILKDPEVMTGAFAEPRLFVAKVGSLLGLTGPEAIGQTQSLMSELASQTLAQVRRLPGAITEKERPFLEMAAAGKLDYTPEALKRLAEIAQIASHNELLGLKQQYDSTTQLPGVGENSGMYPFPKGWRFQPNPETMEPQGANSDRWRMKSGALPIKPQATAPAASGWKIIDRGN